MATFCSSGDLAQLALWLEEGRVIAPPIRVLEGLTFENVDEAFAALRSRRVRGKIAIRVMKKNQQELQSVLEPVRTNSKQTNSQPVLQPVKPHSNLQTIL